jgi:hypothetical protein
MRRKAAIGETYQTSLYLRSTYADLNLFED